MLRSTALALVSLLAACTASPPGGEPAAPAPRAAASAEDLPASLARGQIEFGLNLYRELGTQAGNLFLSPVSLSTALAMVQAGAEGDTAAEMARALRFPASNLHGQAAAQIRDLPLEAEGRQLRIANALWIQKGFPLKPAFLATVGASYGGAPRIVDFVEAPEQAVATVNRWAEEQTNGRIRGLIQRQNVNELTRVILTNAVWFKADWLHPFPPLQTRPRPFHLGDGGTVSAPMMRQRGQFRLLNGPGFEAVELPYKGEEFSMMIFLPRPETGLGALEAALGADALSGWIEALRRSERADLELVVPKLELDTRASLVPPLQALGMRLAFTESAELKGMADAELFLSDVIHQTWLRVDEKGTEAAAATAAIAEIESMPRAFHADRPFFFLIRDNRSVALLFLGRIENPSAPRPA
jgi:serine protease inhibitor